MRYLIMSKIATMALLAAVMTSAGQPVRAQECESAVLAFKAGQIERAAELARKCIDSGTVSGDAHKLLGICSFLLKRFDEYLVNMTKAAELNPKDAEIQYHLGRYMFEVKEYKAAMDRFTQTINLDPDNYKALYFLAICKQGNSDEKGAVEDFHKAIGIIERKKAKYSWPYADLGDLLSLQGDYEAGLSWAYRATRNDPSQPYGHYIYARLLMKKDPTPEIEQELTRAVQLDPGYTQAFYELGRYYAKTGDQERAKAAYAKFNELKNNPVPSPFGVRR
jgi:tetratricopeptide (TPR) repeat protein